MKSQQPLRLVFKLFTQKMLTFSLRTDGERLISFAVVLGLAFGAFAAVTIADVAEVQSTGTEFDHVCSQTAMEHGMANPDRWVWSASDDNCVLKDPEAG